MRDGDDLVIVASRGGSDAMPAWWLDLQANPTAAVQIGTERRRVMAREASAEEKAERWPRLVEKSVTIGLPAPRRARDPGRDPEPGRVGLPLLSSRHASYGAGR